jgi:hypothetical protein
MQTRHPHLPPHRPLASAHRAGNSVQEARHAASLGCDLIETDIWLHNGRLDLRHMHRLGPLPILWERWKVRIERTRLSLSDLLGAVDESSLLFLDLKGDHPGLGSAIVEELRHRAPGRRVALCGRNYPQLDAVIDEPEVTVFYSVGEQKEFAAAWPRLEQMEWPAISIHRKLLTPAVMERLNAMSATVICWDVHTIDQARRLYEMGVDGFTSDNLQMLRCIVEQGPMALGIAAPA